MTQFKRTLSIQSTTAIVIGGVIGSGIFMKPALMASQLGSPLALLSVWVVAGIITLFGALSNAELAAMYPETGGQLVFFRRIYGDGFAFLYGWASFAVFNTGGNASIAYVCAEYTNYFVKLPQFDATTAHSIRLHIPFIGDIFPLENIGTKSLTMALVFVLSYVNYRSVSSSAAFQRVMTGLKIVAILFVIAGLFGSGKGHWSNVAQSAATAPQGWQMMGAYMAALAGAFWAYDGWNNITFVAGEVKSPQRTIPRSLFAGLFFCILVYTVISLAYSYMMPIGKLAASGLVAADAATLAWGAVGGMFIAATVIFFTLGTANANILATARITYTLGEENRWFRWAGKMQPAYQTPGNALWLNACWSAMLIISGSFDMLTDMLIFVSFFFYGMSALGVIILRHRTPAADRPYRVPGYPFVPGVFVGFTLLFLGYTLYNDTVAYLSGKASVINALLGVLITCIGIPIYIFSRRTK
jgi:APA family basic amino acid/polyamine antiporter